MSDEKEFKPLFELGQIVATQGAIKALEEAKAFHLDLIARHVTGDWSEMVEEDRLSNETAVEEGLRVFSSYKLSTDQKIWVITEWNRSVTTLLLPEEY